MMAGKSFVFRFADVEVHEREFSLVKGGQTLSVEPKAFRVLLILLRNPQKLISKEDLLNAVWGDTSVSENSLSRSVALLRRLLGDESRNPRFIETVATVGYRFVSKVDVAEDTWASLERAQESGDIASGSAGLIENGKKNGAVATRSLAWLVPSTAVLIIGLAAAIWYLRRPNAPPRISKFNQLTYDGRSKNLGGTDGSRIYFTQLSPRAIEQVGSNGGEVAQVPIPWLNDPPLLFDIAPDGNTALIGTGSEGSLNHTIWSVRILGGAVRRLGDVQDAEYLADGSIFYTNLEGDIYKMQGEGTRQKKLASPGRVTVEPHLSPNGKVIRFQTNDVLYEMRPDGRGIHPLLSGWKLKGPQWNGRWTPDGKFYLFLASDTPSTTNGQIWAIDEQPGLLRWPSPKPVQLTSGPIHWVGIVPGKDGKTIFAEGQTHRGELCRFDPSGKELRPFLGGISAEFIIFSKDGNSVAYVSYPDGILWTAHRDGSSPLQLTAPPLYPINPHWSPDGKQILFSDGITAKIYSVSPEDASPRRLLPEDNEITRDPDWSPDGEKLVFARGDFRDEKNEDLRIADLASHQVSAIPGSTGLYGPSWSPDGRYIAALAFDKSPLRVFDVETQSWRTLSTNGSAAFPAFSKDSRYIYFIRYGSDQGVFRIGVNGAKPERVADLTNMHLTGFWGFSFSLDPTDAPIVTRDVGTDDIYALTLDVK